MEKIVAKDGSKTYHGYNIVHKNHTLFYFLATILATVVDTIHPWMNRGAHHPYVCASIAFRWIGPIMQMFFKSLQRPAISHIGPMSIYCWISQIFLLPYLIHTGMLLW